MPHPFPIPRSADVHAVSPDHDVVLQPVPSVLFHFPGQYYHWVGRGRLCLCCGEVLSGKVGGGAVWEGGRGIGWDGGWWDKV